MWTGLSRVSDEPTETQLAQLGYMYFSWATEQETSPARLVWGNHVNRRPSSWPVFPRPDPACINLCMGSEMRYSRYKWTQILLTCQINFGLSPQNKIFQFFVIGVNICFNTIYQAMDICAVISLHTPICCNCSAQLKMPIQIIIIPTF